MDLMNDWLISGDNIDAVISNNDEMAIGAIMALQASGKDPKKTLIAGIDATRDALGEMQKGNLAVTVFQDAKGQGKVSVDAAAKLAKGEQVDSFIWIPFELVTTGPRNPARGARERAFRPHDCNPRSARLHCVQTTNQSGGN